MRLVPLLISAAVTTGLVIALSVPMGSAPPFGSFLSPQEGFWQNAEPIDQSYDAQLQLPQLKEKAAVYFDDRLVPHVFAQNDEDLYFIQGYLHAKFRLWQMEFQTHAAAGRLSEIVGAGADSTVLNFDRNMRRLGMVYAATNSLQVMENDADTKKVLDAYTAGANAWIDQLNPSNLPFEYRLLNYRPEHWSNLKTALFLKYMSYDLTGSENDIEYTNAKAALSQELFAKFYPVAPDSLDPIVPRGTVFETPANLPVTPASADSLYFQWKNTVDIAAIDKPDPDNGSNNWAVSGQKTQSGRPILCNDPHLGLSLPSLWYEMQLHTPTSNTYGASFPGSPAIIIGFTDRIAWGVTNASRDVKDYYAIKFKDDTRQEYWYDSAWVPTTITIEEYKVKGAPVVKDTVAYTAFGPVQYDASFTGWGRATTVTNLAVRWQAHTGSNEFKTFYQLNRANNYSDYLEAIRHFSCPAQNFVFASKDNEVAIWQQGAFPAKWKRQGDFVMPGTDDTYKWQDTIPQAANPHVGPGAEWVASANQLPTDTTYPWYQSGGYDLYRGYQINHRLRSMYSITVDDMKQLQTENYNVMAEMARPILLKNIKEHMLTNEEKSYLDTVKAWNLRNDATETGATIFETWFKVLEAEVWSDELEGVAKPHMTPESYTLIEGLLRDSFFIPVDNIKTTATETLADVTTTAFKKAIPLLKRAAAEGKLPWGKYKDTGIRHLTRSVAPLGRLHLNAGGGDNIINATKQYHGPSWRMIVHLTDKTEAWGIYPGGQQGNPGSKYYDNFIDKWVAGEYNKLWVMAEGDEKNAAVKHTITFNK
ncbi:penicillin acylase family protein [Paraflavitalea pollutisoli]|uniref:penicillin acylase family protein n=1 Tax=Paraflavitalea pollutisoli TaxID=3034143 RepID=UPI0023ED32C4|nr:penicillin acylase family protein [Paraflavitalea sp. H1-2-19X]